MKAAVKFTGTCQPVELPCNVGELYPNPCNCTSYYQCYQAYQKPLLRYCAGGTAWDDEKSICDDEEKVDINGICDKHIPWYRCERTNDLSEKEIQTVRDKCFDVVIDGNGTENPVDNTGAIVGGVLGGVILIALVILIVILIKRWRGKDNFLRRITGVKTPVDNPAYSDPYELYDTIDTKSMSDSKITSTDKPPVPTRPLSTLPYQEQQLSVSTINQSKSSIQYDNNDDITGSYSPMVTPRNSEIREDYENLGPPLKHVPSEYSKPYMVPSHILPATAPREDGTTGSDVMTLTVHDYVDFSNYDTEYSLATDPDVTSRDRK